MKVLMVLTSHGELGNTGHKTGFWLEEFAAPYYALTDAGVQVTLASPEGGQPPIDPKSEAPENQTDATRRFTEDLELQEKLSQTNKLTEVYVEDYDGVFFPGGHGPLWDLVTNTHCLQMIEAFQAAHKPVAAVCHGPAVLLQARDTRGKPLVKGKEVTGFTNTEEEAVQLTGVVPFLLEDELKSKGGRFSRREDWAPYVVTDGLLITGQNPASSEEAAHSLVALLQEQQEAY